MVAHLAFRFALLRLAAVAAQEPEACTDETCTVDLGLIQKSLHVLATPAPHLAPASLLQGPAPTPTASHGPAPAVAPEAHSAPDPAPQEANRYDELLRINHDSQMAMGPGALRSAVLGEPREGLQLSFSVQAVPVSTLEPAVAFEPNVHTPAPLAVQHTAAPAEASEVAIRTPAPASAAVRKLPPAAVETKLFAVPALPEKAYNSKVGRGGCATEAILTAGDGYTDEGMVQAKCSKVQCAFYAWDKQSGGAWFCRNDIYERVDNADAWPTWKVGRPSIQKATTVTCGHIFASADCKGACRWDTFLRKCTQQATTVTCGNIFAPADCTGACIWDTFLSKCTQKETPAKLFGTNENATQDIAVEEKATTGTCGHIFTSADCHGACRWDTFLEKCTQKATTVTCSHIFTSVDCHGACRWDTFLRKCMQQAGQNNPAKENPANFLGTDEKAVQDIVVGEKAAAVIAVGAKATCTCTTPNEGTAGKNGYQCSDRTYGWCGSDETCFPTSSFPKSHLSTACAAGQKKPVEKKPAKLFGTEGKMPHNISAEEKAAAATAVAAKDRNDEAAPAEKPPKATKKDDLPAGWAKAKDPKTNRTYYWKKGTKGTQWEKPTEAQAVVPAPAPKVATMPTAAPVEKKAANVPTAAPVEKNVEKNVATKPTSAPVETKLGTKQKAAPVEESVATKPKAARAKEKVATMPTQAPVTKKVATKKVATSAPKAVVEKKVYHSKVGRGSCPEADLLHSGDGFTNEASVQDKCSSLDCAFYSWSNDDQDAQGRALFCRTDPYYDIDNDWIFPKWKVGHPKRKQTTKKVATSATKAAVEKKVATKPTARSAVDYIPAPEVYQTKVGRGGCLGADLLHFGDGFTNEGDVQDKCSALRCAFYAWSNDDHDAKGRALFCRQDHYDNVDNDWIFPKWKVGHAKVYHSKVGRGGCPNGDLLHSGDGFTNEQSVRDLCDQLHCAYYIWSNDDEESKGTAWFCKSDRYGDVDNTKRFPKWKVGHQKVYKTKVGRGECSEDDTIFTGGGYINEREVQNTCGQLDCASYTWRHDDEETNRSLKGLATFCKEDHYDDAALAIQFPKWKVGRPETTEAEGGVYWHHVWVDPSNPKAQEYAKDRKAIQKLNTQQAMHDAVAAADARVKTERKNSRDEAYAKAKALRAEEFDWVPKFLNVKVTCDDQWLLEENPVAQTEALCKAACMANLECTAVFHLTDPSQESRCLLYSKCTKTRTSTYSGTTYFDEAKEAKAVLDEAYDKAVKETDAKAVVETKAAKIAPAMSATAAESALAYLPDDEAAEDAAEEDAEAKEIAAAKVVMMKAKAAEDAEDAEDGQEAAAEDAEDVKVDPHASKANVVSDAHFAKLFSKEATPLTFKFVSTEVGESKSGLDTNSTKDAQISKAVVDSNAAKEIGEAPYDKVAKDIDAKAKAAKAAETAKNISESFDAFVVQKRAKEAEDAKLFPDVVTDAQKSEAAADAEDAEDAGDAEDAKAAPDAKAANGADEAKAVADVKAATVAQNSKGAGDAKDAKEVGEAKLPDVKASDDAEDSKATPDVKTAKDVQKSTAAADSKAKDVQKSAAAADSKAAKEPEETKAVGGAISAASAQDAKEAIKSRGPPAAKDAKVAKEAIPKAIEAKVAAETKGPTNAKAAEIAEKLKAVAESKAAKKAVENEEMKAAAEAKRELLAHAKKAMQTKWASDTVLKNFQKAEPDPDAKAAKDAQKAKAIVDSKAAKEAEEANAAREAKAAKDAEKAKAIADSKAAKEAEEAMAAPDTIPLPKGAEVADADPDAKAAIDVQKAKAVADSKEANAAPDAKAAEEAEKAKSASDAKATSWGPEYASETIAAVKKYKIFSEGGGVPDDEGARGVSDDEAATAAHTSKGVADSESVADAKKSKAPADAKAPTDVGDAKAAPDAKVAQDAEEAKAATDAQKSKAPLDDKAAKEAKAEKAAPDPKAAIEEANRVLRDTAGGNVNGKQDPKTADVAQPVLQSHGAMRVQEAYDKMSPADFEAWVKSELQKEEKEKAAPARSKTNEAAAKTATEEKATAKEVAAKAIAENATVGLEGIVATEGAAKEKTAEEKAAEENAQLKAGAEKEKAQQKADAEKAAQKVGQDIVRPGKNKYVIVGERLGQIIEEDKGSTDPWKVLYEDDLKPTADWVREKHIYEVFEDEEKALEKLQLIKDEKKQQDLFAKASPSEELRQVREYSEGSDRNLAQRAPRQHPWSIPEAVPVTPAGKPMVEVLEPEEKPEPKQEVPAEPVVPAVKFVPAKRFSDIVPTAMPEPAVATLPNMGDPKKKAGLQNGGLSCLSICAQQGPCSFCGTGYCCRLGWYNTSNGCDGKMGLNGRGHVCIAAPQAPAKATEAPKACRVGDAVQVEEELQHGQDWHPYVGEAIIVSFMDNAGGMRVNCTEQGWIDHVVYSKKVFKGDMRCTKVEEALPTTPAPLPEQVELEEEQVMPYYRSSEENELMRQLAEKGESRKRSKEKQQESQKASEQAQDDAANDEDNEANEEGSKLFALAQSRRREGPANTGMSPVSSAQQLRRRAEGSIVATPGSGITSVKEHAVEGVNEDHHSWHGSQDEVEYKFEQEKTDTTKSGDDPARQRKPSNDAIQEPDEYKFEPEKAATPSPAMAATPSPAMPRKAPDDAIKLTATAYREDKGNAIYGSRRRLPGNVVERHVNVPNSPPQDPGGPALHKVVRVGKRTGQIVQVDGNNFKVFFDDGIQPRADWVPTAKIDQVFLEAPLKQGERTVPLVDLANFEQKSEERDAVITNISVDNAIAAQLADAASKSATQMVFEWKGISSNAACETNDEGIIRTFGGDGFTLATCKAHCESWKGCMSIDFYADTGWCNTYDRVCKNPTRTADGASSYTVASRKVQCTLPAITTGYDVSKCGANGDALTEAGCKVECAYDRGYGGRAVAQCAKEKDTFVFSGCEVVAWFQGQRGESCDVVCQSRGGSCEVPSMQKIAQKRNSIQVDMTKMLKVQNKHDHCDRAYKSGNDTNSLVPMLTYKDLEDGTQKTDCITYPDEAGKEDQISCAASPQHSSIRRLCACTGTTKNEARTSTFVNLGKGNCIGSVFKWTPAYWKREDQSEDNCRSYCTLLDECLSYNYLPADRHCILRVSQIATPPQGFSVDAGQGATFIDATDGLTFTECFLKAPWSGQYRRYNDLAAITLKQATSNSIIATHPSETWSPAMGHISGNTVSLKLGSVNLEGVLERDGGIMWNDGKRWTRKADADPWGGQAPKKEQPVSSTLGQSDLRSSSNTDHDAKLPESYTPGKWVSQASATKKGLEEKPGSNTYGGDSSQNVGLEAQQPESPPYGMWGSLPSAATSATAQAQPANPIFALPGWGSPQPANPIVAIPGWGMPTPQPANPINAIPGQLSPGATGTSLGLVKEECVDKDQDWKLKCSFYANTNQCKEVQHSCCKSCPHAQEAPNQDPMKAIAEATQTFWSNAFKGLR